MAEALDGSATYLPALFQRNHVTLAGCQCQDFFTYSAEDGEATTSRVRMWRVGAY